VEKAELPKELPSEETFEEIGLLENDLSEWADEEIEVIFECETGDEGRE
jgi:hypothetical protein